MSKPVLYSYWRSSCSWRVRIALALKGIEYEYRAVSLIKDGGEQHKDEYVSVNPMHAVPTLEMDGLRLTQSLAILEYLDEAHADQGPALLPPLSDPAARANARRLAQIIACDIQPVQNLRILKAVGDERKMAWGRDMIAFGFHALESLLAETAGRYSVGDTITIADVCLVPQVYNAVRFGVDLTPYPTLQRVHDSLIQVPAFQASHPDNMPDKM